MGGSMNLKAPMYKTAKYGNFYVAVRFSHYDKYGYAHYEIKFPDEFDFSISTVIETAFTDFCL